MKHLYFNQDMKEFRFRNETLENAKFIQSRFYASQFINTTFLEAEMDHQVFSNCFFVDSQIIRSTLRQITFENCLFQNITFDSSLTFMESESVTFKDCIFLTQDQKSLPTSLRKSSTFENCEFKTEAKFEVAPPAAKPLDKADIVKVLTPPTAAPSPSANRFDKLEFAG